MPSEGPRRSDQPGRILFNESKADLLNQLGRQGLAIELIQLWLGIVQIDLAGTTGKKDKNAVPRPWGKVGRTVSQRIRRSGYRPPPARRAARAKSAPGCRRCRLNSAETGAGQSALRRDMFMGESSSGDKLIQIQYGLPNQDPGGQFDCFCRRQSRLPDDLAGCLRIGGSQPALVPIELPDDTQIFRRRHPRQAQLKAPFQSARRRYPGPNRFPGLRASVVSPAPRRIGKRPDRSTK